MEMNNQPLVSVPVITYNSTKFVLETLESIKAQTYQNIELIISDDCSTDNTVELCRKWVEENKERFVRTQIITSELNTGVSANLNRAEKACQGEWIKSVSGDDLLLPSCIENYIDYVSHHPTCIYVFGKLNVFGLNEDKNKHFAEDVFDYSFFNLNIDNQLERLVYNDNCIPGASIFYNRKKSIELGIRNDERIPLLEDLPKWINILEKGVKLEFMDKVVVKYRIHNESISTSSRASVRFMESNYLFDLYYLYPRWQAKDPIAAANRMTQQYLNIYVALLKSERAIENVRSSHAYRLGAFLLKPIKKIKKLLKKG